MRFAFKTAPQNTTWADMLTLWRAADDIDVFESGWTFDHFYPIFTDSSGPCLEGWTTLTALAQATKRLRLGTMVTGVHYRHPAVLANMVAALDIISAGRLELGIGAGINIEESDAYGIKLGTVTERLDRVEEACQVLIGLLTRDSTTFNGTYYQLNEARNEPKGPQRPHPPICIGGNGEKRTLPMVARYAQQWNFPDGTPEDFRRKREVLAGLCAAIGRDPREITTSTHLYVGDPMLARTPDADFTPSDHDYDRSVADVAAFAEQGLDLAIIYLPMPYRPAVLEGLADAVTRAGLVSATAQPTGAPVGRRNV
jgi:F420-dependent oxidoreductase-like protein